MGLLSKIFRRGNSQTQQDFKNQLYFSAAQGEMVRGDSESDIAWKNNLAFKYETIHDEDKEDMLAQKCLRPQFTPKVDDNGNLEYLKDAEGNVRVDANGQPLVAYTQGFIVDDNYAALRTMLSHTNRLVFLSPKNKRLVELMTEDIIEDVKMNSRESEFDTGAGAYLNSLLAEEVLLLNDAENGNKVKALLENRTFKTLEMGVGPPKEKRGLM